MAAVELLAPDDGLIAAVLAKQFDDRQLRVAADVVDYLVPRMERSFAAIAEVVAALDTLSLAERRDITVPLARRVLEQEPTDRGDKPWISD
jgi:chromosomal replication initiation ATPase DnaA